MKIRSICVVVSARPSYSRIRTVLQEIREHPGLNLQLILAGSALLDKYGNIENIVKKDGFDISEKIFNVIGGDVNTTMAKTTGVAILELSTAFANLKPDMVITIADRFETIATSIAATYQNIPLVHIQGGEVTGNIDEKVRHANTKLADIHIVSNNEAEERVIKMGEHRKMVFNTGCPSMDMARMVLNDPKIDFNPLVKSPGVGNIGDWNNGYLVVMQHPVTTEIGQSEAHITNLLEAIKELDIPTFWFWPNMDGGSAGISAGIRKYREKNNLSNVYFMKNMESMDFLKLIKNSKCLIGNSSVGIRESALLAVPVVNIGTRQNSRKRANNVVDCGYKKADICLSIEKQLNRTDIAPSDIYGDGFSGKRIANILHSCELISTKTISY